MKLVKNQEYHQRTKHIDVRYHFIKEKYFENEFELMYVSSDDQVADILTKPLPKVKFTKFRRKMGIKSEEEFVNRRWRNYRLRGGVEI